jgi:hypothetical protein
MPIVSLTGFNGTAFAHNQQLSNLVINNNMYNASMTLLPVDNGINRVFGQFNVNDSPGPRFAALGSKYSTPTYVGNPFITVGPSSTDANSGCLAISANLGNSSDWWCGWGMYFGELGFTSTTSYRVGLRVYQANRFSPYAMQVSVMSTNARSLVRFQNDQPLGTEKYYEFEWFADTKTFNMYIDDELVTTTGPGFTTYNPWESICFFKEVYNGGTPIAGTNMEFKDLYIQRIDSAADIRLGSATRVWAFKPSSDDDVSYLRPPAFNSNAAVAAGDMFANPTAIPNPSTSFLSATELGQYDMYNTNAEDIAVKLATIEAVQVRGYGQNPLAGTRQFSSRVTLNGILAEADPIAVPFNTGFRHSRLLMTNDPNGTRWTPATVAALKIGTQVKA